MAVRPGELRTPVDAGPGRRASPRPREARRAAGVAVPARRGDTGKGRLYTPGRGLAACTVPQFKRYLLRNYAEPGEDPVPG